MKGTQRKDAQDVRQHHSAKDSPSSVDMHRRFVHQMLPFSTPFLSILFHIHKYTILYLPTDTWTRSRNDGCVKDCESPLCIMMRWNFSLWSEMELF